MLIQYAPGRDADLMVANWWLRMERDGDLGDLFTESHRTLSALYGFLRAPNSAAFHADERGIWMAMWFEPVMAGAFCGLWVARDRRRERASFLALLDLYQRALQAWPVLFGVTCQEGLLSGHRRLGYTVLGQAPGLWPGKEAWLVMLTRAAFLPVLARYRQRSPALEEVTAHG